MGRSLSSAGKTHSVLTSLNIAADVRFLRIHYVLQMSWSESEPSRPHLTRRAMLDDDWHYLSDDGPREYSLEGDYVAIDSLSGILIWNWKEDTICTLLPEGHEWVSIFFPQRLSNLTNA